MTYYPETAHQSFKDKYRDLRWSYNKENFNLWKEGKQDFLLLMLWENLIRRLYA